MVLPVYDQLNDRLAAEDKPRGISGVLQPIQPQKIYVIAANQLTELIKSGYWSPGSRLPPERELSEMLGISRSSVRQALTTLESIGVLRSKRGVGHFVTEEAITTASNEVVDSVMSQGDPQELLEARRAVEPEVARLASLYRDSDDLAGLYDVIQRMKVEEANGNFARYLDADFYFHLALAYATHNPVIIDVQQVLVERMKAPPWQVATHTIVPKTFAANMEEHSAILAAVAGHKPREARQAMITHLNSVAQNLRNISAFAETEGE